MSSLNQVQQALLRIQRESARLRAEVQWWRVAYVHGRREEAAKSAESIRSILDELYLLAASVPEALADARIRNGRPSWRREWMLKALIDHLLLNPNDRVLILCADDTSAAEIVEEVKKRLAGTGIEPNLETKVL